MTERVHPDGLPIGDIPETNLIHAMLLANGAEPTICDIAHYAVLERRAREAETRVAELERELAWVRDYMPLCWHASDADGRRAVHVTNADDMYEHLASSPPEGWEP